MSEDAEFKKAAEEVCSQRGLVLECEVGSGAFKRTFRVRTAGGDLAALKLYRDTASDARTAREVDAITKCSHPGIVRFDLISTIAVGGREHVYSLEEFLSGDTLSARIQTDLLLPEEIVVLGRNLVSAVGHIAALGLVHRDLKPDNIMFRDSDGPPVIVDFGLVRDLSEKSLTQTWSPHGPGTPFYAAPEQLNNEKSMIDWRTDQFALGVVLTICGRGLHPYQSVGRKPIEVVERVASREQPDPDFVDWAQGAGLAQLVRMVAPWPVSRYRTPEQLARSWESEGAA